MKVRTAANGTCCAYLRDANLPYQISSVTVTCIIANTSKYKVPKTIVHYLYLSGCCFLNKLLYGYIGEKDIFFLQMIEVVASMARGPVFLAGEVLECLITFTNPMSHLSTSASR